MNIRTSKTAVVEKHSVIATFPDEVEVAESTAYEVFESWIDEELLRLEDRFSDFVTRNSFAGSMGR